MRSMSIISGLGLVGLLGCATPKYLPPPTYTLYAPPTVLVALPPEPKVPVDKEEEKAKAKKKALAKEKEKEKAEELPKKNDLPEVLPLPKPQSEKPEALPPPRPAQPDEPDDNIGIVAPIPREVKLPKLEPGRPLPRIDLGASGPLTLPPINNDAGGSLPRIEVEPLQLPPASDPR